MNKLTSAQIVKKINDECPTLKDLTELLVDLRDERARLYEERSFASVNEEIKMSMWIDELSVAFEELVDCLDRVPE